MDGEKLCERVANKRSYAGRSVSSARKECQRFRGLSWSVGVSQGVLAARERLAETAEVELDKGLNRSSRPYSPFSGTSRLFRCCTAT
jgi:hypothetical protein